MKRPFLTALAVLAAAPASAASYNPFSTEFYTLSNTNFVVLIAFLIFMGILFYFKVPGLIGDMLDKRAVQIRSDLDEARALRDEAQTLLASYERKQREVADQAARIVAQAKEESQLAANEARASLEASVARRLQAAEEKIASAEASALRGVRDRAVQVAVAAAGDVLARQMTKETAAALIEDSIKTVEARLH
jgi:F-type H+-transporting ATPase subunit b